MKLFKYLKNYSYYRKSRKNNESRICQICLSVSDLCNSRCVQCDSWKAYARDPLKKEKEFKLFEIEKMLKASKSLKHLNTVSLTGGEPALRPDLVDIAKAFKKENKDIRFFFQTNGLDLDRVLAKGKEINLLADTTMCVSIDGLQPEHDKIRGVEGGYEKTKETIYKLREAGLELNLSFNITPESHAQLKEVWNEFKNMVDYFSCRPIAVGAFFKTDNKDNNFILDEKQIKEVSRQLKDIKFVMNIFIYQVNKVLTERKRLFPCGAGLFSLIISPELDVYPCPACPSDWCFGNLRDVDYNLDKLLESAKGKAIKEKVKACRKYETEFCINEPEFFSTAHFQTFHMLWWILTKSPSVLLRNLLGRDSRLYKFISRKDN